MSEGKVLKQWRVKNLSKIREQARDWARKNPDKTRKVFLKFTFGITPEDYNQMFVTQNGLCAICLKPSRDGTNLRIDHNHETGKIRGLLCENCNFGLGHFKDNSEVLLSAVKYLTK